MPHERLLYKAYLKRLFKSFIIPAYLPRQASPSLQLELSSLIVYLVFQMKNGYWLNTYKAFSCCVAYDHYLPLWGNIPERLKSPSV